MKQEARKDISCNNSSTTCCIAAQKTKAGRRSDMEQTNTELAQEGSQPVHI